MNWLKLSIQKQQELFKQLNFKTGIQAQAIEKDAWGNTCFATYF